MTELRRGNTVGAPHEILDPRDLKYCSNQCSAHWTPEDDPFQWRERLPFARWGLAELQLMGWPLLALTILLASCCGLWRLTAIVPAILLAEVVYFFRDPRRAIPADADAIVSPADGTIAEIVELEHYDFIDGPGIRIGIFLSIFNVHINRAPREGTVLDIHYTPG
jgi:phosphatidylserine decarboxylase